MTILDDVSELIDHFIKTTSALNELLDDRTISIEFDRYGKLTVRGRVLTDHRLSSYMPERLVYTDVVSISGSGGREDRSITGSPSEVKHKIAIMLRANVNMLQHDARAEEREADEHKQSADELRKRAKRLRVQVSPHPLEALAMEAESGPVIA